MICPTCKEERELQSAEWRSDLSVLRCPFICPECKKFLFTYRAIRDIVLIWPIPLPEKFVEDGVIVRAPSMIDSEFELRGRSDYGIVLSYGPGHHDGRHFHSTHGLKVGQKVIYDKLVPWRFFTGGCSGKSELVVICGFQDIQGVCED